MAQRYGRYGYSCPGTDQRVCVCRSQADGAYWGSMRSECLLVAVRGLAPKQIRCLEMARGLRRYCTPSVMLSHLRDGQARGQGDAGRCVADEVQLVAQLGATDIRFSLER